MLRESFSFGLTICIALIGYSIVRSFTPHAVIFSDASSTGYGSYLVKVAQYQASGVWTLQERLQSSTFRELQAVINTLKTLICAKKTFPDNQNVVRILTVGSRSSTLQNLAVEFFQLALCHNISFQAQWIPRSENSKADYLSRLLDPDDWYLNPELFKQISSFWGPFEIDRMSDHNNAQLKRFNSKF